MCKCFMSRRLIAVLLVAAVFGPARAQEPADKKIHRTKAKLVQRTYAVADLVVPIDDYPKTDSREGTSAVPAPVAIKAPPPCRDPQLVDPRADRPRARARTIEDALIATIKNTVAPHSWSEMGGPGTIDYFPLGMALVINQTAAVHEQIAELLAALQRLQETQVAVEVRLVSLATPSYERVVKELPLECARSGKVGFWNDRQLHSFLETAQADRSTNIMQTPKVTAFNGQTASINITEQMHFVTRLNTTRGPDDSTVVTPVNEAFTVGLQMSVRPLVSADRCFVNLNLKLNNTHLATAPTPLFPVMMNVKPCADNNAEPVACTQFVQQPQFSRFSIDRSLAIPDGGTVVLGGWKETRTVANQSYSPVLSWLPYVGLLFSDAETVSEPANVLVMVTPRIIVNEQQERRQTGYVAPAAEESEPPTTTKQPAGKDQKVAKLLERYYRACRDGRRNEAQNLALKALVIDPMCFGKRGSDDP